MERNIVYIAVFAALIAALGLVPKVTLLSGIPITAQSMGIMLCGAMLGARKGALAVLLFLGLVALGLPLLAGGRGGLGVFTTPWAGFLFGFPVAAFATGLAMRWMRGARVGVAAGVASVFGGIGVLYLIAVPYYMAMTGAGLPDAIATAMIPFIPGDLVKAVVAGAITGTIYKARPRAVMSRA
ncbi:biotin transporter BioY [Neptunicoccus sediminis]|uniref:biotin transporter BioY n=1 Tax=Neptunicoccus sediminis TaxID=1892596 RepID=UPI000845F675|nr:biotin transporter BioY [Neptunicoccus sediminis]